jgi:hypothetical protein
MSNDTRADKHVVGTLRSVDGTGVVRMEDRAPAEWTCANLRGDSG